MFSVITIISCFIYGFLFFSYLSKTIENKDNEHCLKQAKLTGLFFGLTIVNIGLFIFNSECVDIIGNELGEWVNYIL